MGKVILCYPDQFNQTGLCAGAVVEKGRKNPFAKN